MHLDLVVRARQGDQEAFGVIAETMIGPLYNLALLMLDDSDQAKDAVQEGLICAWRDIRGLRDPARFTPWLHRILVRCVYRVAGRERRHSSLSRLISPTVVDRSEPTRDFEDRDLIDRGFRALKAEYRAVLVVHHYLGLSYDEAAEVLGVPPGTVKSRLNRATQAMRAALDADARSSDVLASGTLR